MADIDDGNERVVERTTVVNTDSGGGSGAIVAIVLILALLVLAYVFRDNLGFGGSKTEIKVPDKINVNVN
ncbi:hypothetical protein [Sphingomonas astaxanthinifaciens]|jgi:hypothetical protein|uniref:Uncharacterized protein n=1 Tax=Sphingomonas astaxanthinifaciens DSM 22298 TaxID=1123267 RepID=A0ABQ5Z394_9SPHN|nr:hypothetical protein [Sphingomonas astaxanthinifaciens]GLR46547.1 hypothetical protein GCM10007925_02580 [Sphingomonas astaxanthinifaciens DSM 22298]